MVLRFFVLSDRTLRYFREPPTKDTNEELIGLVPMDDLAVRVVERAVGGNDAVSSVSPAAAAARTSSPGGAVPSAMASGTSDAWQRPAVTQLSRYQYFFEIYNPDEARRRIRAAKIRDGLVVGGTRRSGFPATGTPAEPAVANGTGVVGTLAMQRARMRRTFWPRLRRPNATPGSRPSWRPLPMTRSTFFASRPMSTRISVRKAGFASTHSLGRLCRAATSFVLSAAWPAATAADAASSAGASAGLPMDVHCLLLQLQL